MKTEIKLNKKKWLVLKYFIEQESMLMPVREGGAPFSRFRTIPYKIEKDLGITRVGAGDICKKLKDNEFFEATTEWSEHQRTIHYALRPSLSPLCIRILILAMREFCNLHEQIAFMKLAYVIRQINLPLVNDILAEKGVGITRSIDILDWDSREVAGVAATCNYISRETGQPISLVDYVRNEIAQEEARSSDFFSFMLQPIYILSFPIVPTIISPGERFTSIQEKNRDLFNEHPDLLNFRSGFDQVFGDFLKRRLLFPILSLIQISPSALAEFVCGTWDSFEIRYADSIVITPPWGGGVPCNLLFSLVALAVADISRTMDIPRSGIVEDAYVRSRPQCSTSHNNALLVLRLKYGYDLSFDFNITTRKLSNDWKPPAEPSYTVDVTYSYRDDLGLAQTLLSHSTIRDPVHFLAELRNRKNPVSNHIQQMFSNRMQNLLHLYDPDKIPSFWFMECLLEEINQILFREDFFKREIFLRGKVTKETLEFATVIQENNPDSWSCIQRTNRQLFDEAYFGLVEDSRDPDAGIQKYSFEPVIDEKSLVLVLSNYPSDLSLVEKEYYADPSDLFWKLIGHLCKIPPDTAYEERITILRSNHIALWDLLAWAIRDGTYMKRITDFEFNDIVGLLKQYPNIRAIVLNGSDNQSPESWFEKYRKVLSEEDLRVLDSRHIDSVICSGSENRAKFELKLLEWIEKVWGRVHVNMKPKYDSPFSFTSE